MASCINFSWLPSRLCLSHLPRTFTTHTYTNMFFQIMSMLYVMYARCLHIIDIVMCPLHVFRHMPYFFRLSYITGHVISTYLFILIYGGCQK